MEQNDTIFTDINPPEIPATTFQRIAANFIDLMLEFGVMIAFYFLVSKTPLWDTISSASYLTYVIVFLVMFSYRFFCIFLMQKTIGMIVLKLKYLNAELDPLTSSQKLIAVFAGRTENIRIYKSN